MTPAPVTVGANHDRFTIKASLADLNYVVPEPTSAEFVDAVLDIVERDRINLIIGTDENVVKALSDARDRFPFDLMLPRRETIDLCQDKQALNTFFRDRDIPVPRFYEVGSLDDLEGIFARFEGDGVLWCRVRRGSLSLGATPVANVDQARSWITMAGFARNKGIRLHFGGIPAGAAFYRDQRLVSRTVAAGAGDRGPKLLRGRQQPKRNIFADSSGEDGRGAGTTTDFSRCNPCARGLSIGSFRRRIQGNVAWEARYHGDQRGPISVRCIDPAGGMPDEYGRGLRVCLRR
jgi:hypothetical protein